MSNDEFEHSSEHMLNRHMRIISDMKTAARGPAIINHRSGGLAELQKSTALLMDSVSRNWGFAGSRFRVIRQKTGEDRWKITVENPKTREVILEAEGRGDKIFAYEDNLARMAEALTDRDLTITTPIKG